MSDLKKRELKPGDIQKAIDGNYWIVADHAMKIIMDILGSIVIKPICGDVKASEDKTSEAAKDLVASGVSFTRIDPAFVFKTTAGDLNVTCDPSLPPDQLFYEQKAKCDHQWVPIRRKDLQNCRVCERCGEREIR